MKTKLFEKTNTNLFFTRYSGEHFIITIILTLIPLFFYNSIITENNTFIEYIKLISNINPEFKNVAISSKASSGYNFIIFYFSWFFVVSTIIFIYFTFVFTKVYLITLEKKDKRNKYYNELIVEKKSLFTIEGYILFIIVYIFLIYGLYFFNIDVKHMNEKLSSFFFNTDQGIIIYCIIQSFVGQLSGLIFIDGLAQLRKFRQK